MTDHTSLTRRNKRRKSRYSEWLTSGQAAKELGFCRRTLLKWCRDGKIAFKKTTTGRHLIHEDEIARVKFLYEKREVF